MLCHFADRLPEAIPECNEKWDCTSEWTGKRPGGDGETTRECAGEVLVEQEWWRVSKMTAFDNCQIGFADTLTLRVQLFCTKRTFGIAAEMPLETSVH